MTLFNNVDLRSFKIKHGQRQLHDLVKIQILSEHGDCASCVTNRRTSSMSQWHEDLLLIGGRSSTTRLRENSWLHSLWQAFILPTLRMFEVNWKQNRQWLHNTINPLLHERKHSKQTTTKTELKKKNYIWTLHLNHLYIHVGVYKHKTFQAS